LMLSPRSKRTTAILPSGPGANFDLHKIRQRLRSLPAIFFNDSS